MTKCRFKLYRAENLQDYLLAVSRIGSTNCLELPLIGNWDIQLKRLIEVIGERAASNIIISDGKKNSRHKDNVFHEEPGVASIRAYLQSINTTKCINNLPHNLGIQSLIDYYRDLCLETDQHIVISFQGEESVLAACYASLKRVPLFIINDLVEIDLLMRVAKPRSFVLFGNPNNFGPEKLIYLRKVLRTSTEYPISWGIMTGRSHESLSWIVLKSYLYSNVESFEHILLYPLQKIDSLNNSQKIKILYAPEISRELLTEMLTKMRDLIGITSHGDEADAYLYKGFLCGRTKKNYEPLYENTRGKNLIRCFCELDCYRKESSKIFDQLHSRAKVLIPVDQVFCKVLLLNSCNSLMVNSTGRYHPDVSLVLNALDGYVGAVIASDFIRCPDLYENVVLSALILTGKSIGEATALLNDMQYNYFSGTPSFVVVGDPDLRLAKLSKQIYKKPVSYKVNQKGIFLCTPSAQTDFLSIKIPSHLASIIAEHYSNLQVRSDISTHNGQRFYLIKNQSLEDEILIVSPRHHVIKAKLHLLFRSSRPDFSDNILKMMQKQLSQLQAFLIDLADEDIQRIRRIIKDLRKLMCVPRLNSAKVVSLEVGNFALIKELLHFQSKLVFDLVRRWADAMGGDIISLKEEDLIYGNLEISKNLCSNCGNALFIVQVNSDTYPDFKRIQYICNRCTIVADLPFSKAPVKIQSNESFKRGEQYEVRMKLLNRFRHTEVVAIGAAVLGSRGLSKPAVAPIVIKPGESQVIKLRILSEKTITPGLYYLKVVLLRNLEFSFQFKPISILGE